MIRVTLRGGGAARVEHTGERVAMVGRRIVLDGEAVAFLRPLAMGVRFYDLTGREFTAMEIEPC